MLKAKYSRYLLNFKVPAGTSRGVLHQKETWFIKIYDTENPQKTGIGECAVFRGLSSDDSPDYEKKLHWFCQHIQDNELIKHELIQWPSIQFGIETALYDFNNGGSCTIFSSPFTEGKTGIPINGLIWMGDKMHIKQQVKEKLEAGFRCLKFKVGSLLLNDELEILHSLRKEFTPTDLTIRLDANGAFNPTNVLEILNNFSKYSIHSIEQPIKAGNLELMALVCEKSPISIALDEELIGCKLPKKQFLSQIKPAYIILKPSLTGSFSGCNEWINIANNLNIGWWITSALESNIGLNAIAQYTATLESNVTHGLGTGALYTNNIPSPLYIEGQKLRINPQISFQTSNIPFHDE